MKNTNTPQLTRKTNDSLARKLHELIPSTNQPSKKRSVAALKFDLLQPIKPHAPASPTSHNHPLHTTPLKLARKNPLPPVHRTPIHVNFSSFNLSKLSENQKEKAAKVDKCNELPLNFRLAELRPKTPQSEVPASRSSPKCPAIPLANMPRLIVSPKTVKPVKTYPIASPLKQLCVPKSAPPAPPRRTCDLSKIGLEVMRASKPPGPARMMRPLASPHTLPPIALPKPPSPMVSPSKKRKRIEGPSVSRARRLIEMDQSSLRMWQSDLEAGALREGKTRKFHILKVVKDKGSQIAHCVEISNNTPPCNDPTPVDPSGSQIWRIFLRGPDCTPYPRIKIFAPWSELEPNMIICNKFIPI
ncbi:hypothetical protein PCANC_16819 [Puccinia coronata f. sp. avenae]|uniref:Uncharacterized protein n=1 Tax=Puccinia coronata f. sp. avenae TaxID=200324 RepID=A0A2N5SJR6_9BASI|nr:hypothetical protein PCANC_16819 [Puccinia coronata f. sp. avenae]